MTIYRVGVDIGGKLHPQAEAFVQGATDRAILAVPLLREGEAIESKMLSRQIERALKR